MLRTLLWKNNFQTVAISRKVVKRYTNPEMCIEIFVVVNSELKYVASKSPLAIDFL